MVKRKQKKMDRLKLIIISVLILLLFTSCADTVPYEVLTEDTPYGFWSGIWHGIIAPISFIGSLIWDDISMYAVNNNGGWYDCGFWFAVGGLGQLLNIINNIVDKLND